MSTSAPERLVRWFDDRQVERWWLGFPIGVFRKYADDRGSALAALVTFHIFVGLLPLLVVVLTVFGQLLEGSEDLRDATLDSALAQLPVVGEHIREDVSGLVATGPVVVIAVLGLLWTATGIYHSLQLALNQVWNVEGVDRQGFVSRHVRAVLLFAFLLVAAIGTAPLRSWRPFGDRASAVISVGAALGGIVAASLVLVIVFRLVVSPAVATRQLVPAAVLGGALWLLLQRVGTAIVSERLTEAGDLYGALGVVVVTLFWINLLARAAILANEWAVVAWRELWPRRIAQPPLTDADRRVLEALMRNELRRPEEHADIRFDPDRASP